MLSLVTKHQVISYDTQDHLPFPSLLSFIREIPSKYDNIRTSSEFLKYVELRIDELTVEQKQNLSTYEFLELLWEDVDESCEEQMGNETGWKLQLEENEFLFFMEDKLTEYMLLFTDLRLAPFYHFALWCSPPQTQFEVILKRLDVKDIYTLPYNPFFLKAIGGQMSVKPIRNKADWDILKFNQTMLEDAGQSNHELISLNEAIALTDARKCQIRSSRSFVYLPTKQSEFKCFKKVKDRCETSYSVAGDDRVFYELQESIISRYFKRINGKRMIMAEFASNYEFAGNEESISLWQVYESKEDQIKDAEYGKSIVEDAPFPEIILCTNGDVMLKKKKFKIIKYPTYQSETTDYKFSKVLLYFYPLPSYDELNENTIEEFFNKSSMGRNGRQENLLKRNERLFLLNSRSYDQL